MAAFAVGRPMINTMKKCVGSILGRFGYAIYRIPSIATVNHIQVPPGSRLYVGCGKDHRDGYIGCDIRPLPNVKLVCNAWSVASYCRELSEIYSRHSLEHFTFAEAEAALANWHAALAMGGKVHIVVPNLAFHFQQWLRAEWSEHALAEKWSDARWGFAGLYGWQSDCHPWMEASPTMYWDVHKSGYDSKLLAFLLSRAGFSDVNVEVEDQCHLVGRATKRVNKGERQVAPTLHGIRMDHRARYEFAAKRLASKARILDIACGVGYGCRILAEQLPDSKIVGIDIREADQEYASEHYAAKNVAFKQGNAQRSDLPRAHFEAVVSFETIEHLEYDARFLADIFNALRPGGIFICSTPNQEKLPFDPKRFPYHVRHYTTAELEESLTNSGFMVVERRSQPDRNSDQIDEGWNGLYNIAVCQKPW